jgi:hypothetical protein
MTPAACAGFRRAAALLHVIPGLRATVWSQGRRIVKVTPRETSPGDSNRTQSDEWPAVPQSCHPCLFRRAMVIGTECLRRGEPIVLFGLTCNDNPRIDFFTQGSCRIAPCGLISWAIDPDHTGLCFATLLPIGAAMEIARDTAIGGGTMGIAGTDGCPDPTRVDFSADDELDATLVYATVRTGDSEANDRAVVTLLRLMAVFGAEEIASDPDVLKVTS